MHTPKTSPGFICLLLLQLIFLGIFWVIVRYDKSALPPNNANEALHRNYPPFQDIHVMIFVGFGFLMTFLKKYGYSATGFTLFLAALIVQWALIVKGFFEMEDGVIRIGLKNMIDADIAAAVPLISMGALLGRITPVQLLFMALIEVTLFAVNEFIQLKIFSIADVGGSITVHAFGAYFGLAVSVLLRPKKDENESGKNEGATYTSDIFAMIGTLFLWLYWPSFNSVLVEGNERERAILNTYLSLAAATVTTFVVSSIVSHENKLDMVHVQNSTLAGGVAVGSCSNFIIGPHGAILIGIVSGLVSVLGYRFLSPVMTSKLRIHDTCGVHNLHGMPAIISAIFSAIYACLANGDTYKSSLEDIFPAMKNSSIHDDPEYILGGYDRTALQQGGYQVLGITVTVLFAIVSGILTGLFLKTPNWRKLKKDEHHLDEIYWEVPDVKNE